MEGRTSGGVLDRYAVRVSYHDSGRVLYHYAVRLDPAERSRGSPPEVQRTRSLGHADNRFMLITCRDLRRSETL